MKKLLVIESSTEKAEVTLAFDGQYKTLIQEGVQTHARTLLPMIDKLLKEQGFRINDLDGLVFGRGPGSFTGIRIATALVKGLSFAYDLPIFPVSGLQAIAYATYQQKKITGPLLAVLDARMKEVYWAYYESSAEEMSEEHLSSWSNITIPFNTSYTLAGFGFKDYLAEIELKGSANACIESHPSTLAMVQLTLSGCIKPVDAEMALPVYIRNQVIQGN